MKNEILQAFSEITLRNRGYTTAADGSRFDERGNDARRKNDKYVRDDAGAKVKERNANEKRERSVIKRCFNCGIKDYVSQICPIKAQDQKCFECNRHGHIARNCPTKTDATITNSCPID